MSDANNMILMDDTSGGESVGYFTRGKYDWVGGTPTYQSEGATNPDDFAWHKFAVNKLASYGGRLRVGPTGSGGDYFTNVQPSGGTQYVTVGTDGIHLDFARNAKYQFRSGLTSYALFRIFDAAHFKATGGTFKKHLSDVVSSGQHTFYVKSTSTGSADFPTFEDIHFEIASGSRALKNFYHIRVEAVTPAAAWPAPYGSDTGAFVRQILGPRVEKCNIEYGSVQQTSAHDTELVSGVPAAGYANYYGGALLLSRTTRHLMLKGNTSVSRGTDDDYYCGGIAHIFDDEQGVYEGNSGYGFSCVGDTDAATGGGGTLTGGSMWKMGLYKGSGGGFEGSHYVYCANNYEGLEARFLVDQTAAHYAQIFDNQWGRILNCAAVIHSGAGIKADPNAATAWKGGSHVKIVGNDFHNVSAHASAFTSYPPVSGEAWPGADIWLRDTSSVLMDHNRHLFTKGSVSAPQYKIIMDVEEASSVGAILLGDNNHYPGSQGYNPIYKGANVTLLPRSQRAGFVDAYGY